MTDRPIIFSASMVRALLGGRKTQTRRVLKLAGRKPDFIGPSGCKDDPTCWGWEQPDGYFVTVEGDELDHAPGWRNGWRDWRGAYAPGDRLWVREAYATWAGALKDVAYRADDTDAEWENLRHDARLGLWKIRPSIHMPRQASRLTLIVTDVRVQRLKDISRGDAMEEGCPFANMAAGPNPIEWFADLWKSIHGHEAWDANPWVCALTFTVHRDNIDSISKEA